MKKFSPIIIVIILAAVAVGVTYWRGRGPVAASVPEQQATDLQNQPEQPQPTTTDETVNWKTYRNDKYNFEFKYPAIKYVIIKKITAGPFSGKDKIAIRSEKSQAIENSTKGDYSDEIGIFVSESIDEINRYKGTNFKDIKQYMTSGLIGSASTIKENNINGTTVYENEFSELNDILIYLLEKDKRIYEFAASDKKSKDELRQIISTFKFIK